MKVEPLVYVCMMSAFNLPEFESCLLRKPSHLVLVVSDFGPIKAGANLFEQLINRWFEDKVTIIRPDHERTFGGQDLIEYQNWLQETLSPALAALPADLPRACNITGGNKIMALGLMHAQDWDWIDYKAEQKDQLQEFEYDAQNRQFEFRKDLPLPLATAQQVAELYARQANTMPVSTITEAPGHIHEAQRLWDGLSCEDSALMSIFGNKKTGLEHIWMYGRSNKAFNSEFLSLSIQDFIAADSFTPEQLRWLEGWSRLAPTSLSLEEEGKIRLPGNAGANPLKRWLSGDWLELLVASWLEVAASIPKDQIAVNLKINPNEEDHKSNKQANYGERETDIMVHTKKGTTVIEIKTDLPPTTKGLQEAIRQVTSFGDRVGRSKKILFVGPQLYRRIEANIAEIELSCKAAKVILCSTKEELLEQFQ